MNPLGEIASVADVVRRRSQAYSRQGGTPLGIWSLSPRVAMKSVAGAGVR